MMCIRCKEEFGPLEHCQECGVHKDRPVRRIRRRKVNGKRGRNSGQVKQSKNG